MFSSQQTGQLIGIGILTQMYICEHSHFIAYMKSFQGKIIHAENDWIFIIVMKFTIIGADIADGQ